MSETKKTPTISLCVPTYKRIHYLTRLLNSIITQTYKDYEIIITDNSDDNSVFDLVNSYKDKLPIQYFKNDPPTGMAANWNINISKAGGEWLKMMHDDDYFNTANALELFAEATRTGHKFIACGYDEYHETKEYKKPKTITKAQAAQIDQNPFNIFIGNIIGPPSVTMVHNSIKEEYDVSMKWRVDIDYYIRVMLQSSFYYIDKSLVDVGYSEVQTTNACFGNPDVEIPEALMLYAKHGEKIKNSALLYDSWWRLMRNLNIRSQQELTKHAYNHLVPQFLKKIVAFQSKIPQSILLNGLVSKLIMIISYLFNNAKN